MSSTITTTTTTTTTTCQLNSAAVAVIIFGGVVTVTGILVLCWALLSSNSVSWTMKRDSKDGDNIHHYNENNPKGSDDGTAEVEPVATDV
jgi:hypothetical protein